MSETSTMTDLAEVLLLAVIQGVTEFLPISSDGHLAIAGGLLGVREDEALLLAVLLHAGTLLSMAIYFRKDIMAILLPFDLRLATLLAIGNIPAGVVGIGLKVVKVDGGVSLADRLFSHTIVAGLGLLVTAALLFWASRQPEGGKDLSGVTVADILAVGAFQAFAILPGVSRSGGTIAGALWRGVSRRKAATLSFLLGMPAIAGATLIELKSAVEDGPGRLTSPVLLGLGVAVAAAVGYASLLLLVRALAQGKLQWFARYCAVVGLGVVVWRLLARA